MGKLIISRKKEWQNRARKFKIYINGEKKGLIENGEIKELELEPGKHKVIFKIDWCTSREVELEIPAEKSKSIQIRGYKLGNIATASISIVVLIFFVLKVALKQDIPEIIYFAFPGLLIVLYYLTFGREKYIEVEEL